ncbi:MAG TPA: hypothetical protein VJZ17_00150 [Nitrosopumilaceae archaeon]|nr:hypothetical protein [Nitrosopumilaceae archaeon]
MKRNNYNVKLLRGYGVSINLKNNHLGLKNVREITIVKEFVRILAEYCI